MTTKQRLDASVMADIETHAFSDVKREVGGVLVGRFARDSTEVAAALPALSAVGSQTNVTFTHEVWAEVLPVVDRDYPGCQIVGWYHTHPGFGIFLSEYDTFIHRNFFSDPRMLALVIDPLAGQIGWFSWGNDEIVLDEQSTTSRPGVVEVASSSPRQPARATLARRYGLPVAALVLGAGIGGYALGQQAANTSGTLSEGSIHRSAGGANRLGKNEKPNQQGILKLRNQIASLKSKLNTRSTSSPRQVRVDYVVRRGDTVWGIAESLYGDGHAYKRILSANPGLRADELAIAQRLRLPGVRVEDDGPRH